MKKPNSAKKVPAKKTDKSKDAGEVKKSTLKPLKEKEKKSWKNNIEEDEEEDFNIADEDIKLDSFDEEEEDDAFFDDNF